MSAASAGRSRATPARGWRWSRRVLRLCFVLARGGLTGQVLEREATKTGWSRAAAGGWLRGGDWVHCMRRLLGKAVQRVAVMGAAWWWCWGMKMGDHGGLTESRMRMNWSTSTTGGALKLTAWGGTAVAGTLGAAGTGATGSGAALFLGGRGMVDANSGGVWWFGGCNACSAWRVAMVWWWCGVWRVWC